MHACPYLESLTIRRMACSHVQSLLQLTDASSSLNTSFASSCAQQQQQHSMATTRSKRCRLAGTAHQPCPLTYAHPTALALAALTDGPPQLKRQCDGRERQPLRVRCHGSSSPARSAYARAPNTRSSGCGCRCGLSQPINHRAAGIWFLCTNQRADHSIPIRYLPNGNP